MAIDAKQLIAGWCSPADDLKLTGERQEPDTDFVLVLQSGEAEIVASLASGSDRLRLSQEVTAADAAHAAGALARLEEQRPAPVSISAATQGVTIRTWIVLDGLTKHSLLRAVGEMSRTREAVLRVIAGAAAAGGAETAGAAASAAQDQSAAATPAAAAATSASSWGASPQSGYQGSGGYAGGASPVGPLSGSGQGYSQYGAQPAPQGPWTPGHKVPPQGMQAWAVPDPNSPVIANLGGHLPVQVTEMRGAWARVVCSNGWTGWVDGRLLVAGP